MAARGITYMRSGGGVTVVLRCRVWSSKSYVLEHLLGTRGFAALTICGARRGVFFVLCVLEGAFFCVFAHALSTSVSSSPPPVIVAHLGL